MTTLFEQAAAWAVDVGIGDVPTRARHAACRAIVDIVGVTFAARGTPFDGVLARYRTAAGVGTTAASAVRPDVGARPVATLIGQGGGADPEHAALVNAAMGHALDFDDGNDAMQGHPSTVIFPAALAAAEIVGAPGARLLEAYIAGFEVAGKIGRILGPTHRQRGWHPTATVCAFGATTAAAKLLGLDRSATATALAMTASTAAGINANVGSMTNPIHAGRAAQAGLFAARMAAAGASANVGAFEATVGGFALTHQGPDEPIDLAAIGELGRSWELIESGVSIKPFPCCGMTHVAIDAALAIRARLGGRPVTADDVDTIEVGLHPVKLVTVDRPGAKVVYDALFSVHHVVALALHQGAVGVRDFTPEAVSDAAVQGLSARVTAAPLPEERCNGGFPGEVTVTMADGRQLTERMDAARGNGTRHPLTDEEVDAKFRECLTVSGVSDTTGEALLSRLRRLEDVDDLTEITRLLA